jgi:Nif-specific regulatory protein
MVAYLAVQSGPEKGKHFPLDPARPMHIGRGSTCEIMLSDPVSSRFHAVVYFEDGNWHLRDTSSSNGTFVNGQKAMQARMLDQAVLRIGSTELRLIEPTVSPDDDASHRTVIRDVSMEHDADDEIDPLREIAETGHLFDLYLLSLSLLRSQDANDVSESVLRLLLDRTRADAVGLSFDSGDGQHKAQSVIPAESAKSIKLGRNLIRRVIGKGEAIWTGSQQGDQEKTHDLKKGNIWSDAIYVPLDGGQDNLGVLHLYRKDPSFRAVDFELAVAAGRLLAVGLTRALKSDSLKVESKRIADRNADTDKLIGSSPVMLRLKEKVTRIGKASGSVLVRGESGSGKELVARAVYHESNRALRPMLTVNCAAIPPNLIESQLFGHKKGAFTGADADHAGWFQQAHTGTLFLDEIGELTLEGQAKLLRILEGHPFLPVGATEEVLVDVRVIAATNRDLAEFVREKQFREDLFYRLSVFELIVPPLRDRGEDIERLVNHFLQHFRLQHGRGDLALSDDALERLLAYAWPGNVRQLRNVIDSAVVMADDPAIMPEDLGLRDAGLSRLDTLRIDEWEKRLITKALQRSSGSVPDAAKLLGISRATAYRKITEYEIDR